MTPTDIAGLQARLQEDTTGEVRSAVLAHLRVLQAACADASRQLSDRETYKRVQAAGVAVNAALRIVEMLPQRRGGGNAGASSAT